MQISIDHTSKLPLHVQVENLMRQLLNDPVYQNGSFLPKEVELANRLGVSRNTIRQATNKLQHEGLLIRKKGVGTMAAPKRPLTTGLDHWYSFTQEMKEQGIHVINLELKIEYEFASQKIADFFGIEKNTKLLKLSKLKGTEGEPIVYFQSYFHPRIGVSEKDDFNMPLYSMLESNYGIVVARSLENISAELAGNHAAKLGIAKSAPVLARERFVYDVGDRPVEYNLGYYRSDKFTYSMNIKKA